MRGKTGRGQRTIRRGARVEERVRREQGNTVWLVLGTLLLVVLNLPGTISRRTKAGLREGLAPLQTAVSGVTRGTKERWNLMLPVI